MTVVFDENGLQIQTYAEILAEVQDDFRAQIAADIDTDLKSVAGQLQRLIALRELHIQEKMLEVYQSISAYSARGVNLDQRLALLGVNRLEADYAVVLGTASGVAATVINDGVQISVGDYVFEVTGGPYTIGGGGTVTGVELTATETGEIDVSTLGAWTIVTVVAGFSSFTDTSQPNMGRAVETDPEYRARGETERYRRSGNSLAAIEAAILEVDGVTYAKAWHNVTTEPVDADNIPYHAINCVVQGGADADVAAAIVSAAPAGHLLYGTDVTETVGTNTFVQDVSFDRVDPVMIWIRVTLTTSTAEEAAPDSADLEAAVLQALSDFADEYWEIGRDVVVYQLIRAIADLDLPGIDAIAVTISTDDGAGDPYSTAKRSINLRSQATYDNARVTVTEA